MGRDEKDIREARQVLVLYWNEIHSVGEWADRMGFDSVSRFSKQFKKCFGFSPHKVIIEERLGRICGMVAEDPGRSGYEIAREAGLKDEKALYNFLARHSQVTLTRLRDEFRGGGGLLKIFRQKKSSKRRSNAPAWLRKPF